MTDIEKLKALFDEVGIGYNLAGYMVGSYGSEIGDLLLACHEGDYNVKGHPGFFTAFRFDKDGKFVEMGAWE